MAEQDQPHFDSVQTTPEFIAVGCNRTTQAAAWGKTGTVAFAANRLVALYDPTDVTSRGVFATLHGHTDRVNCVDFIERGTEKTRVDVGLISGSADNTAIVWKKLESTRRWVKSAILSGHTATVNVVASLQGRVPLNDEEKDILATASADGTVRVWSRVAGKDDEDDVVECVQIIDVGPRFAMALAITHLPGTRVPLLAVGGVDSRIAIYTWRDATGEFKNVATLQGHENWIRGLSFAEHTNSENNSTKCDLLLASASQDRYIRLWRFTLSKDDLGEVSVAHSEAGPKENKPNDDFDILAKLRGDLNTSIDEGVQLSTKAHMFDIEAGAAKLSGDDWKHGRRYTVMLEALLLGHDDWVHSVKWQPPRYVNGRYHQPLNIITASADKSMIVWAPDETGVWVNVARMGEVGGVTMLGFFGGEYSPDGRTVMAHSQAGTFHMWTNESSEDQPNWQPRVSISGHFAPVQDLQWEPLGRYFLSVSHDRTARLFAPWRRTLTQDTSSVETWHEIARPQVHGYDLQCLAFAGTNRYVSGADEKVLRAFEAPRTFDASLDNLAGKETRTEAENSGVIVQDRRNKAVGASLPALGLSNKAVFTADLEKEAENDDEKPNPNGGYERENPLDPAMANALSSPPYEELLQQNTLWPEVDKLYGHGYEIMAVAVSHDGEVVAATCKAASAEHARVRLFSGRTWKELCRPLELAAHTLTITRVRFSPDDKYLLAAGRDRFWSLYERRTTAAKDGETAIVVDATAEPLYRLIAKSKAHARILWDCSWASNDLFATGSRDKTVKIWQRSAAWTSYDRDAAIVDASDAFETLKFKESVTAIEFSSADVATSVLAVGLESGRIHLFSATGSQTKAPTWLPYSDIDPTDCHATTVRRLAFRPLRIDEKHDGGHSERRNPDADLHLATCGDDHTVRLFAIPAP